MPSYRMIQTATAKLAAVCVGVQADHEQRLPDEGCNQPEADRDGGTGAVSEPLDGHYTIYGFKILTLFYNLLNV